MYLFILDVVVYFNISENFHRRLTTKWRIHIIFFTVSRRHSFILVNINTSIRRIYTFLISNCIQCVRKQRWVDATYIFITCNNHKMALLLCLFGLLCCLHITVNNTPSDTFSLQKAQRVHLSMRHIWYIYAPQPDERLIYACHCVNWLTAPFRDVWRPAELLCDSQYEFNIQTSAITARASASISAVHVLYESWPFNAACFWTRWTTGEMSLRKNKQNIHDYHFMGEFSINLLFV